MTDRIERLERSNRRLYALLAIIVGGLALMIFTGAANPPGFSKSISAESFVLVDGEGTTRAFFSMSKGRPMLSMLSADGKPALLITMNKGLAGLSLFDQKDDRQLTMACGNGNSQIAFFNGKGAERLRISEENVLTGIYLKAQDKNRMVLGITEDHQSGLVFTDETGKALWSAP